MALASRVGKTWSVWVKMSRLLWRNCALLRFLIIFSPRNDVLASNKMLKGFARLKKAGLETPSGLHHPVKSTGICGVGFTGGKTLERLG